MSTLHIRLPSKSVADNAAHWIALPCPYALVAGGDTIEREGQAALSELAGLIGSAQRVVLLLAASDVTLLHPKLPPLSPARLRAALPNLVEDQLISDPAECVIVAGDTHDGLRTVAVMQRGWLEILLQTFNNYGARQIVALPSQLCLPLPSGGVAAAITPFGTEFDLTLRLAQQDGLGLPLLPDTPEAAPQDAIETLCAIVPTAPVALYVPQEQVIMFQHAAEALLPLDQRVTVFADSWMHWIAGARTTSLNLLTGLGVAGSPGLDWRRWRWPMILATLLLLLNAGALNYEWWRLAREAAQLRTSMVQIYKTAYPKETVIVDPAAQMRQKIAAAQHDAGQAAPDDFAALAAGFAAAWANVEQSAAAGPRPALASIEYRDRSLLVKPKAQPDVPLARMKSALAQQNLSLSQSAPGVWQIRSIK
ncbi:MAG: general secretion pathway protein GspL [Herminiimonas sp.]|nr:general secretion pathway protein GspL [Herminiimonas sp.]